MVSPVCTLAPAFLAKRSRPSIISKERSDTGNTRFPRSTLSFTLFSSSRSITSWLLRRSRAEYKNRGLLMMLVIKVRSSQALVTLQRPLPVMPILRPTFSFFSNKRVRAPACAAFPAASIPAAPAPITITSYFMRVSFRRYRYRRRHFHIHRILSKYFPDFPNLLLLHPDGSCSVLPPMHSAN